MKDLTAEAAEDAERRKTLNRFTGRIIGAAIAVHKALGPGLLESAYEACMAHELACSGLSLERQKPLPLIYRGVRLDCGYRLDLLVEESVIVEIKSVDRLEPIHEAQLLSYLRLMDLRLGLLINFNVCRLRAGLRRMVNEF